jgi:hypothetical protein
MIRDGFSLSEIMENGVSVLNLSVAPLTTDCGFRICEFVFANLAGVDDSFRNH